MKTEKRDQLLQAALELFAEQGFRGTSTAEIAKHAGVATGTLFHHFSTKEELINTLYREIKTELAENMSQDMRVAQGARETIRLTWFNYVSWGLQNKRKYRLIKHCEASPYISESVRQECEVKFKPLFELFGNAIADGLIKDLPVELLLNLLSGSIDGFIRYLTIHPEEIDNQQLWEQAYSASWDTIR